MGNGSGLKSNNPCAEIPLEPGDTSLTPDMIANAAQAALSNFGSPTVMFLPPQFFMATGITFEINPEYRGTPWASTARMTKREHAVAKLHTTLKKLGVFKKLSEDNLEEIKDKSIRRLKRARWARYQQGKTK